MATFKTTTRREPVTVEIGDTRLDFTADLTDTTAARVGAFTAREGGRMRELFDAFEAATNAGDEAGAVAALDAMGAKAGDLLALMLGADAVGQVLAAMGADKPADAAVDLVAMANQLQQVYADRIEGVSAAALRRYLPEA